MILMAELGENEMNVFQEIKNVATNQAKQLICMVKNAYFFLYSWF